MFRFWKKNKNRLDMDDLYKRAKNNDINAQYELSLAYYRGIHVPKNMKKSNFWFDKANNQCKSEDAQL